MSDVDQKNINVKISFETWQYLTSACVFEKINAASLAAKILEKHAESKIGKLKEKLGLINSN